MKEQLTKGFIYTWTRLMAFNLQQQSLKSMQSVSIFQRISDLLGISHEFKLPSDGGGIGTMSKSSGEWSGIIGDLLDGKVDIVVSEMAVNVTLSGLQGWKQRADRLPLQNI